MLRSWALLVVAVVAVSVALDAVSAPSATLFAGLLVGLGYGVSRSDRADRRRLHTPAVMYHAAHAATGVVIGQLMNPEILRSFGADWLPVAVALLSTLALTVLGGYVLAATTGLALPTSVFGMIAGGAAGVIALSDEAGADPRIVAVTQYLRVLLVLAIMPAVTALALAGRTAAPAQGGAAASESTLAGVGFLVVVALAGTVAGRLVRLPSATLLGPMLLALGIALVAPGAAPPVPTLLVDVAFAVIGLEVGMRFRRAELRRVARLLPAIITMIAALVAGCGGLAVGIAAWTGRALLDCYLATTPGGLYAVLAASVDTGADVPFVTSMQVLRLFVMLLSAPLLARLLTRPGRA